MPSPVHAVSTPHGSGLQRPSGNPASGPRHSINDGMTKLSVSFAMNSTRVACWIICCSKCCTRLSRMPNRWPNCRIQLVLPR